MQRAIMATLLSGLFCTTVYANDGGSLSDLNYQNPMTTSVAMKNKQAGDAFLAENKAKPGVVALPNGLQYKVIEEGHGKKPSAFDTVTVDYEGRFINGAVFDSSFKRGEPATFSLSAVIPGWTQALQLMPVGSTWEVYIPSQLAYGQQGMPPVIDPNQTLIFKVTLRNIEGAPTS